MSVETILTRIKKRIAYANPEIDLTNGNVTTDLGVDANAEEFNSLDENLQRIKLLYLLENEAFTDEEADALANSLGIPRILASRATTTLRIGLAAAPAFGMSVTYSAGSTVATAGTSGAQKTFVLTSDGIITSTTPFNPNSGYYECSVSIQATEAGTASNVGQGTINTVVSMTSSADIIYNPDSVTNGSDIETTDELLTRIKQHLAGLVSGTIPYYEETVSEDQRVVDLVVVDPDHEYSLRGPASIDVYIQGSQISSYNQLVSSRQQSVDLDKKPVVLGSAVVSYIDNNGNPGSYTEGDGFTLVKDTTSFVATSTKAHDKLVWDNTTYNFIKTLNEDYTISYSYNRLVEDLQTQLTARDVKTIGADILVKETTSADTTMAFGIVTLPGFDFETVKNNVIYNIQNYVNNLKLNIALRQSDIINIIENTSGVDYLRDFGGKMFTRFCLLGEDKVNDLEATPLEYYRIAAANIIVG